MPFLRSICLRTNQAAAGLILLVGLVYATRTQLMPYHLALLNTRWEALPEPERLLFRLLLNGAGALAVAVAVALFCLMRPIRRGERWPVVAVFVVGMLAALPTTAIVLVVRLSSAAEPPLALPLVVDALLIVGFVTGLRAGRGAD